MFSVGVALPSPTPTAAHLLTPALGQKQPMEAVSAQPRSLVRVMDELVPYPHRQDSTTPPQLARLAVS